MATKPASTLTPGDLVLERDGCEWRVHTAERDGPVVVLRLWNLHGYMSANPTCTMRVLATDLVRTPEAEA